MPRVIYEVNLEIEAEIERDFSLWLKDHIHEILQFEGFVQAKWFTRNPEDENKPKNLIFWTIHYYLKDRKSLENYFEKHASRMRQEGMDHFGKQFKSNRRILEEFSGA
jgi:hypothetical protein